MGIQKNHLDEMVIVGHFAWNFTVRKYPFTFISTVYINDKISKNRSLMLIKPVSSASEICWKLELLNLAIITFFT